MSWCVLFLRNPLLVLQDTKGRQTMLWVILRQPHISELVRVWVRTETWGPCRVTPFYKGQFVACPPGCIRILAAVFRATESASPEVCLTHLGKPSAGPGRYFPKDRRGIWFAKHGHNHNDWTTPLSRTTHKQWMMESLEDTRQMLTFGAFVCRPTRLISVLDGVQCFAGLEARLAGPELLESAPCFCFFKGDPTPTRRLE